MLSRWRPSGVELEHLSTDRVDGGRQLAPTGLLSEPSCPFEIYGGWTIRPGERGGTKGGKKVLWMAEVLSARSGAGPPSLSRAVAIETGRLATRTIGIVTSEGASEIPHFSFRTCSVAADLQGRQVDMRCAMVMFVWKKVRRTNTTWQS